jgi:hypothetical protein
MSITPIPPEALPSVQGLDTPQRFYRVLRTPAPLAGMAFPNRPSWKDVAAAGFESLVCLTDNIPPYDPSPLRVRGTGRTGTVIACTLTALGMGEPDVLNYMGTVNAARRKSPGWPESRWQKDQVATFLVTHA